jgi:hypothetical protein
MGWLPAVPSSSPVLKSSWWPPSVPTFSPKDPPRERPTNIDRHTNAARTMIKT